MAQDGAPIDRSSSSFPSATDGFRILAEFDRGLLRGGRRRAHHLAVRAGTLQGLHLDAEAERLSVDPHDGHRPGSQRVELQIRTHEMHDIAEYGIAAHALYKDATGADAPSTPARDAPIAACRQTIEALGQRRFRRSSSSIPSSNCSRTRSSASPQGAADRLAARRDGDRFRLRGAYRRRQFGGRRENQRPHRAADLDAAQWRRGGDRRAPTAARRPPPGTPPGRHRPRARRHPPRHARGCEGPVRRARPADRRAGVRPRRAASSRRPSSRRRCGRLRAPRSTTCSSALGAASFSRPTWFAPSIRISRRSAGRARRLRQAKAAGSASPKAANLVFRVPGKGGDGRPLPLRGIACDPPVRFAPKGGAVPGERIVGIRTPGEGITIYPIHSPALVAFDDQARALARRSLGPGRRPKALYSTQIVVTALNEPGALGVIATTIGEYGGNIDAIASSASGEISANCASICRSRHPAPQRDPRRAARQEPSSTRSSG